MQTCRMQTCSAYARELGLDDLLEVVEADALAHADELAAEADDPDDVELQVGSRIKLWAHNTHVDIGFAYAHPSIDGHPRFAHCR